MELKPIIAFLLSLSTSLLIVPYGIETRHNGVSIKTYKLLIVPYGIETFIITKDRNDYLGF